MTAGEIIALAAVACWVVITEIQIINIKREMRREFIVRRSVDRIRAEQISGLWEDIRAAGIKRHRREEEG